MQSVHTGCIAVKPTQTDVGHHEQACCISKSTVVAFSAAAVCLGPCALAVNCNLDRGFTLAGGKGLTITKQVFFGEWLA
jgi:hypothetical protein